MRMNARTFFRRGIGCVLGPGQVRALVVTFVMGGNPLITMANSARLKRPEFVIDRESEQYRTLMTALKPARERHLYDRVVAILEDARAHVSRTVNTSMVHAYWLVGREIVEVEQHGRERAGYGDRLIEGLAKRLMNRFGKGFSAANIRSMRQFFLTYPQGSALPEELGGPPKKLGSA
jgi:hypothetical protein